MKPEYATSPEWFGWNSELRDGEWELTYSTELLTLDECIDEMRNEISEFVQAIAEDVMENGDELLPEQWMALQEEMRISIRELCLRDGSWTALDPIMDDLQVGIGFLPFLEADKQCVSDRKEAQRGKKSSH